MSDSKPASAFLETHQHGRTKPPGFVVTNSFSPKRGAELMGGVSPEKVPHEFQEGASESPVMPIASAQGMGKFVQNHGLRSRPARQIDSTESAARNARAATVCHIRHRPNHRPDVMALCPPRGPYGVDVGARLSEIKTAFIKSWKRLPLSTVQFGFLAVAHHESPPSSFESSFKQIRQTYSIPADVLIIWHRFTLPQLSHGRLTIDGPPFLPLLYFPLWKITVNATSFVNWRGILERIADLTSSKHAGARAAKCGDRTDNVLKDYGKLFSKMRFRILHAGLA